MVSFAPRCDIRNSSHSPMLTEDLHVPRTAGGGDDKRTNVSLLPIKMTPTFEHLLIRGSMIAAGHKVCHSTTVIL